MSSQNKVSLRLFTICMRVFCHLAFSGNVNGEEISNKDLGLLEDREIKLMVNQVGPWLMDFKFNELDRRFMDEEGRFDSKKGVFNPDSRPQKVFMRHFPIPPLRKLNQEVTTACEQGFMKCLSTIYKKVKQSPMHQMAANRTAYMKRIKKAKWDKLFGDDYDYYKLTRFMPFESDLKHFQYRATASYYMCWYTMKRERLLENIVSLFPGQLCDTSGYDIKTGYVVPKYIRDFRTANKEPFECALLSFCPDPCCGKMKKGLSLHRDTCFHHSTNPCLGVANGGCHMDLDRNVNFEDLIHNRINFTCNCDQARKGFEWNLFYGLCVDIDECLRGTYECQNNQVCRNTPGSYFCSCKRGYKFVNKTGKCEHLFYHSASEVTPVDGSNGTTSAVTSTQPPNQDIVAEAGKLWDRTVLRFAEFLGLAPSNATFIFIRFDLLSVVVSYLMFVEL